MRYLIDGYNLMFAGGLLGRRLGPQGFRKVRHRFLNDLADTLGGVDAHQTVVVFDASTARADSTRESPHKGLRVIFAVDDENADARIEQLIAKHATPKQLTVVSSDRRIRQAAERRRARAVTADDFWVELDRRREVHRFRGTVSPPRAADRPLEVSPLEVEGWMEIFGELDSLPETREALGTNDIPMLTDAEIAEIEREVERETGL